MCEYEQCVTCGWTKPRYKMRKVYGVYECVQCESLIPMRKRVHALYLETLEEEKMAHGIRQ